MAKVMGHVSTAGDIFRVSFAGFVGGVVFLLRKTGPWLPVALTLFFTAILSSRDQTEVLALMNMAQPYLMFIGGFCLITALVTSDTKETPREDQNGQHSNKNNRFIKGSFGYLVLTVLIFFLLIWLNRATWALMAGALVFLKITKSPIKEIRTVIISLIGASLGEHALRHIHYSYSLNKFQNGYRFEPELDLANMLINSAKISEVFATQEVILMGLIVLGWIMIDLLRIINTRKYEKVGIRETAISGKIRALVYGLSGAFCAQFGLLIITNWVRMSSYHERYLAVSYCFLTLIFSLAVTDLLHRLRRSYSSYHQLLVTVGVYLLVGYFSLHNFKVPGKNRKDLEKIAEARAISAEFPSLPLLGQYWGVYIYPALQVEKFVIPVLTEGDYDRMPWNKESLQRASEILVSHLSEDKFGSADHPIPQLEAYGKVFILVKSRALRDSKHSSDAPISLYKLKQ